MKTCTLCLESKPIDAFSGKRGGLTAVCSVYTGGDAADVLDEAIAMATHDELQAMN